MAIPNRHNSQPGTYFVTSRSWESRAIFNVAPPCEVFIESLLHYRDVGTYALHAFVLMPDHVHIILTPSKNMTLERAVQFIKGGSARAIRERLIFHFPVWQRGFSDHRIRDAADYDMRLRYLENNPAKKRLVASPTEYRWSSASGALQMDPVPQGLKPQGRSLRSARLKPCPDEIRATAGQHEC